MVNDDISGLLDAREKGQLNTTSHQINAISIRWMAAGAWF